MLVSAELNTLSELSLIFNQFVIHPGVSTPGCFLLGLFRVQTGPDMTPVQVTPPTFLIPKGANWGQWEKAKFTVEVSAGG